MAKAQGGSLNPSEITGMCGRLRCCLIYEYEQYVQARKKLPKQGKRVGTSFGEGKVVALFPLKETALIDLGDRRLELHREEIVPLQEWRALQEKAAKECDRSESCTCGRKESDLSPDEPPERAKRPGSELQRPQRKTSHRSKKGAKDTAKAPPTSDESDDGRDGKPGSTRRRRRRRRRR
jgi:hypothetical protein